MSDRMSIEDVLGRLKDRKFDNLSLLFYKWGIMRLVDWNVKRLYNLSKIEKREYLNKILRPDTWSRRYEEPSFKPTNMYPEQYIREFSLPVGYRLVVGMGYPSAVENGFLFHHTYGVPYIPGEALKGLTRFTLLFAMYSHLFRNIGKSNNKDEKEKRIKKDENFEKDLIKTLDNCLTSGIRDDKGNFRICPLDVEYENNKQKIKVRVHDNIFELLKGRCLVWENDTPQVKDEKCKDGDIEVLDLYEILFGSQKKRGEVIFFDAFPVELKKENFELDIMNPHYGDYYRESGKKPPADWYNPNPIIFLTIANVRFQFALAFHPLNPLDDRGKNVLDIAKELLQFALTTYGIGGKTRVGYGWFK